MKMSKVSKLEKQKVKIELILCNDISFYLSESRSSLKGLMETMLLLNIDDKSDKQKEEDLLNLLDIVQIKYNYTIRDLCEHMWRTVVEYYNFLVQVKANNYKELEEFN